MVPGRKLLTTTSALPRVAEHGAILLEIEVQHQAPLVAVDLVEQGRLASGIGRRQPLVVTGAAPLDLDHVGAEIRENGRAIRRRDPLADFENLEFGERACHTVFRFHMVRI